MQKAESGPIVPPQNLHFIPETAGGASVTVLTSWILVTTGVAKELIQRRKPIIATIPPPNCRARPTVSIGYCSGTNNESKSVMVFC